MFLIFLYFVDLVLSVIRFYITFHWGRISFVLRISRGNLCEVILDVFHSFVFWRPSAELGYNISFRLPWGSISIFLQISRENYCEVIPDVFHRFEFFRPPPELGS